jgi:hypothetical protein
MTEPSPVARKWEGIKPLSPVDAQADGELAGLDAVREQWLRCLGELSVGECERVSTTKDAFRLVHTESAEALSARVSELHDLSDEGLAVATSELFKRIM